MYNVNIFVISPDIIKNDAMPIIIYPIDILHEIVLSKFLLLKILYKNFIYTSPKSENKISFFILFFIFLKSLFLSNFSFFPFRTNVYILQQNIIIEKKSLITYTQNNDKI